MTYSIVQLPVSIQNKLSIAQVAVFTAENRQAYDFGSKHNPHVKISMLETNLYT